MHSKALVAGRAYQAPAFTLLMLLRSYTFRIRSYTFRGSFSTSASDPSLHFPNVFFRFDSEVIRFHTFCAMVPGQSRRIPLRSYTFCGMLRWSHATFEGSVARSLGSPSLLRSYTFPIRSHAFRRSCLDAKIIFVGNDM